MRLGTEICRSWVAEYTLLIPAVSMMCIPPKNPKPWAFHTQLDPSQVLKQVTWGLLGSKKNATGLIYPRLV